MAKKAIKILFFCGLLFSLSFLPAGKISSADLDFALAWTSNTYAPADYQGRALPTLGSKIEVVAMPTGKFAQNPEKLLYRWKLDDSLVAYAKGIGKSSFEFGVTNDRGDSHEVECQVMDSAENNLLWRGFITIKIVGAQVLLKEANSDYAGGAKITSGTGRELKVTAIPLFFHAQKTEEVGFSWLYDNMIFEDSGQKDASSFVLKIPSGELDQVLKKNLSVTANHKTDKRQSAKAKVDVEIK